MKTFLLDVCEFCTAAAGLLVWAPRRGTAFEHVARKLEDASNGPRSRS